MKVRMGEKMGWIVKSSVLPKFPLVGRIPPGLKILSGNNTYLIVPASRTMMTPTINMATHTPPIMYKLSFGASARKKKSSAMVKLRKFAIVCVRHPYANPNLL